MGTQGTAELDFGAFPGASHATVAVTGQAGIVAGSLVEAWIRPVATTDHSADEHMLETLKVFAADIVAATGFTIHGFNCGQLNGPVENDLYQSGHILTGIRGSRRNAQRSDGQGTRLYGKFTIAWVWN